MQRLKLEKMIGGELALHCNEVTNNYSLSNVIKNNYQYFYLYRSGRDAIEACFEALRPTRIWMPEYICESVWNCAERFAQIKSYKINDDLEPDLVNMYESANSNDIIFVSSILGSKVTRQLTELKKTGAKLLIDTTHCLLDPLEMRKCFAKGDFIVGSLRKTFPIPDGGFVYSKKYKKNLKSKEKEIDQFVVYRMAGLISRGIQSDSLNPNDINIKYLKLAEEFLDNEVLYGIEISDLSKRLLYKFDFKDIITNVKRNRKRLRNSLELSEYFKIPKNSNSICPYFPLILKNIQIRDELRKLLRNRGILCPVHWPTPFLKESHSLSNRILSIPCDARFRLSEIDYIANTILEEILHIKD